MDPAKLGVKVNTLQHLRLPKLLLPLVKLFITLSILSFSITHAQFSPVTNIGGMDVSETWCL